ncbi:uncharacterized protein [Primulina eburnea]|uniref:uncharacterized protein n=1 Tax=Primulina eburnea TaxID=1245227 RepID=UPI003C6C7F54
MEKLLNRHEKECVRKAMLRHEETFRDQVNELHRLHRTQKILMKDLATVQRINGTLHPRAPEFVELENRAGEYNSTEAGENSRVLEADQDDQSTDLELTLGPRSYCQRKIKAAEPGADLPGFGPGFSSSSCMKTREQKKASRVKKDWIIHVGFSRF